MKPMPATKKKQMSAEHKAALAAGRAMGRAVKNYLEALETNRPKRGRKRTAESINSRLEAIENTLPDADPVRRLSLIQERIDLQAELAAMDSAVDLSALEDAFVEVAKKYSESKGLSYTAWREAGVPADVLRRAGITRSGR
jgi:uncharacterized protein YicC (UPF0701 family)